MAVSRAACLVLLVGCGRLGFDGQDPGTNLTDGVDTASPRAPDECEAVGAFATAFSDADLSVAKTPTGATVFWASASGSDLYGIDIALDRSASPVTVVRSGLFQETAAAYVDGRLIVTGRSDVRGLVHAVPSPIGVGTELANFGVSTFSKTALVGAGPDRIMATSCGQVGYNAFDASWAGVEGTYARTSPGSSDHIEIVPMGARALTAVSLDTGCQFEVATDRATSETRISATRCESSRLATDGANEAAMVLENSGGVEIVVDAADTLSAEHALPIGLGSSPRVLRTGGRYWLSFLDPTGNVVVGYVDNGTVLLRPLVNAPATAAGYELAVFDGAPWIIGVDPGSAAVYGRRLCAR